QRLVSEVRKNLSHVVLDAHRAGNRPDQAVRDRIFAGNAADALRAIAINIVLRQQIFVLVELWREAIEKSADGAVKSARQILAQAADTHVAREHPEPGEQLVDVQQQLALPEAVEHHRD